MVKCTRRTLAGLFLLGSCFFLLIPAALAAKKKSKPPAPKTQSVKIVFVGGSAGKSDIYTINVDGSGLTNLSKHPADYKNPIWSPDNKSVAFMSDRDGKRCIYLMNATGSGLKSLDGTGPLDTLNGWTPDGNYLLVTSYRDVNAEIYALRRDGKGSANLTADPADDADADWSPDGNRLAFASDRGSQGRNRIFQIYIKNMSNGQLIRLTNLSFGAVKPLWSPDGTRIAFGASEVDRGIINTYIMNADGSVIRKLTDYQVGRTIPQTWSGDGNQLIVDHYTGNTEKNCETLLINLKGSSSAAYLKNPVVAAGRQQCWQGKGILSSAVILLTPVIMERVPANIALINARLIDGNGGQPLPNAVVLIRDGLIENVGPSDQMTIPDGYRMIDLKGATVLPGFINSHVHGGYSAYNLRRWAEAGVTTVRDLGADPDAPLFEFRNAVLQNPGYARLVAAGPMVTVPDGYPIAYWNGRALTVDSPEDARLKVTGLLDDGADIIKISLESGTSFGGAGNWPILSPEETRAIVDTAHQEGIRVSAHVSVVNDLVKAIDGGVDDIAHMVVDPLSEALAERMAAQNIYWVPTLELWKKAGLDLHTLANLSLFIKAGGKVALGTDFNGAPYPFEEGMPLLEMDLMRAAGMTPMQIIQAATKNAAYVCNREDVLGTIEVGKIADILVVNDDPLADLSHLANVRLVLRDGVIIVAK